MPVFTVHMPLIDADKSVAAEKSVFVRDGFHFWAFILGPLWLLWHRLWLAAILYLLAIAGLEFAMSRLGISNDLRLTVMIIIALLVGFEATSVWRWSRSRGRWREVGVVVSPDRESAERRFFAAWTGENPDAGSARVPPPSPPPVKASAGGPHDVIGLFPQPGGQR